MATDYETMPTAPARLPLIPAWRIGALALLVGAMLLLGTLVYRLSHANDERDRALTSERHSYEVMLATRSAESSMAKAEAALGRYAISADRAAGVAYYDDWVLAGAQIDRLASQVRTDVEEATLVDALQRLYLMRGTELGLPATQASRHQGWDALSSFNAAGHSPLIRDINRTLQALREHERDKLQSRVDRSQAISTDSTYLGGLLSVTVLALVAATAGLVWAVSIAFWQRRQAEDDAEEAVDRAEWLREAVATRTAELSRSNALLQEQVHERGVAEAQLRQMQKMDALGRLTGGIAHDFNNMLAVIVSGLDLARRRLATDPAEATAHIDHAMDGADRAAALTRRLLGFARAEPLRPEAVVPARLIAGMSELVDRALGELVTVERRLATDCWPVWADPRQLENAMLNLAVNGRDAMRGAGTITIAVANAGLGDGAVGSLPAGDYVRIDVADTGAGMTADVLERVFEPFFTTKPVGKGTGLGMSQIFGFVRQSGGDVAIASAPGRGTTVSLYLPRAAAAGAAAPAAAPASADIVPIAAGRAGARTVLVVEDDARVRAGTVGALEELGYRPIDCESAEDGLLALAGDTGIDVVITDVVMPGMSGLDLAREVRANRPHVEILFVTGYSGDEAGSLAGETLLRKPFTIAQLGAAVDTAFARIAPSAPPRAPGAAAAA